MIVETKKQIVAFSGGKDSTAMALRMAETGENFSLLYTATGNELPEVREHINKIVEYTGVDLIDLKAPTLSELIAEQNCLPNWRMRWCTRMIKIEPCIEYLKAGNRKILCIGLRADEPTRQGLYGDFADYRYPLQEWAWGLDNVVSYCKAKGFEPPKRTDCAVCFYQTINEWQELWRQYPEHYAQGERWEAETGFTFRSPGRDTWPPGLKEMRQEFERGRMPRKRRHRKQVCRICSNS
jgi:PP-loop superfamily ATP-utilizing enzyme